jgi:hypothetical protein
LKISLVRVTNSFNENYCTTGRVMKKNNELMGLISSCICCQKKRESLLAYILQIGKEMKKINGKLRPTQI